jgi:hypothetical protein
MSGKLLTLLYLESLMMRTTTILPAPVVRNPVRVSPQARLLLAGLGLGGAVDLLFYRQALGISLPVFVLLALGALFALSRVEDVRPAWRNLWLPAPLLFFAGMVAVRADTFLTALNVLATLALLGLLAYFYAAGRVERLDLIGYPLALLAVLGNALLQPAPLVPATVDVARGHRRGMGPLLPVLRGLALALPVLLLFSCLLASADAVFARYLGALFQFDFLPDFGDLFAQGLIVIVAGWFLAGALVYALRRRAGAGDGFPWEPETAALRGMTSLGFVEVVTIVSAVNLLFLAFGAIQFAYLFGGRANITVAGFSYADYARRGFFELVAVSVLTLGLILGLQWLVRPRTPRQTRLFNGLSTLMIGLVLVLLASALQRMLLYEEAYGYTHLRLYVHVFMLWLAATFLWLLGTLWVRSWRFAIGAFVCALGFLATLNVVNPDVTIARENLERYQVSARLDTAYLTGLSDDAVPLLVANLDTLHGEERALLRARLLALAQQEPAPGTQTWPAFHLARKTAATVLAQNRARLEQP